MSLSPSLHPLTDSASLTAWVARSHREPVLIFKHSLTCGTSAAAHEELERFLAQGPPAPACGLVVVQTHRAVSNDVASMLGVAHQSPQALLVVDGVARWHTSHWRITAEALAAAVAEARPAQV